MKEVYRRTERYTHVLCKTHMKRIQMFMLVLAVMLASACDEKQLDYAGTGGPDVPEENGPVIDPIADEVLITFNVSLPSDTSEVDELHWALYINDPQWLGYVGDETMDPIVKGVETFQNGACSFDICFGPYIEGQEFTIIFWAQKSGHTCYDISDLRYIEKTDSQCDVFYLRHVFATTSREFTEEVVVKDGTF